MGASEARRIRTPVTVEHGEKEPQAAVDRYGVSRGGSRESRSVGELSYAHRPERTRQSNFSPPLFYDRLPAMSSAVDLKTKEEKDAELDKRIEALRKKNEALVKRYQEIQEDKKKAEQEGIAVTTPRKPRTHEPESERRKTDKENLTVIDESGVAGEKRVVNDRKPTSNRGDGPEEGESSRPHGESPPNRTASGRLSRGFHRGGRREPRPNRGEPWPDRKSQDDEGGDGPIFAERTPRGGRRGGRGGGGTPGASDRKSKEWEEKRRQNIEKMNEEMEKIAEYESGQQADGEKYPIRNFLDDPRRSGPVPEVDRKEGSRRHMRNWGGVEFDNVKTGAEVEKEWTNRRPSGRGSGDMTLSMTGRERAEYLRWKKEREQIDEERLARHRNATGQWRREWDAQKTDTMFKEDSPAVEVEGTPDQSNRREDTKRPPKIPSLGDFLGQGKTRPGGRGRGKGRGQGKSYSMHDNRWDGEHEEEKGRKEEQEKEKGEKDKETENEKKVEKVKALPSEKTDDGGLAEDDEEEWEDASDGEVDEGEEEGEGEEELEKTEHEEEEKESPKDTKPTEKSSTSSGPSTPSPKEQRAPRPKVHIPSPQEALSTPEGPKPLSPFFPLDSHQPVSDWGEEMEMLSPKSSLGESPLRPSSSENSPAQSKAEHNTTSSPSHAEEPEKSENTSTVMESTTCETQQEEVPAKSTENAPSNQDTAEPAVPPTPDITRQTEDSEAPAVEPDQSQPESKTNEDVTADQSEQAFSGAVLITSFETVAFRKKSLTLADG
ncbi:coiled-coil domain-containing protein 9 isoform X2 [Triplophysa dalaica]|uniref:coiled-coil domain-containing protein 9 isoform X2 n=1 Tax=Triplophysa dalaica TaxID=1582913 RepID=UPI0024DF6E46|nr:coiled-coil domain-containing protein 9 isoform X2 [Triplophysa dalaica]